MATLGDDRYVFTAEWYDANAALVRRYQLLYFPKDGSVSMVDLKDKKTFLKRTKYDGIRAQDLYIGASVNIFSRLLNIVDYGDAFTLQTLGAKKESKTLGMVKPDAVKKFGLILDLIQRAGFQVSNMRSVHLNKEEACQFYKEHMDKSFFGDLVRYITSGPVIAMELRGEDAVNRWRQLLGPTDPHAARKEFPGSVRAQFGTDKTYNAAHGSDALASASRELEFFFPATGVRPKNTAVFSECTLGIIKPHAVAEGVAGRVINEIAEAGFEISSVMMASMDKASVEEFYEVYKGVAQEYPEMVKELTSGPCIAMEIRAKDAPTVFRELCGPSDPDVARHLRPHTIRARFGRDKVKNAIHCTDLPEDGQLEVEYFFKILDRSIR